MKYLVVIPALNPGKELIEYVDTLLSHGYTDLLLVDDGSREDVRFIFDVVEKKPGCRVLRHDVNLGKGRALKDAMRFYLDNYMTYTDGSGETEDRFGGIITVDSDGQHTVEDVNKVAAAMKDDTEALILGARDFDAGNVPPKSLFGNKCTRVVMKLFIGADIKDTQTGLRGIPNAMMERFSRLKGERFEYETRMLIDAIGSHERIVEVPIETVYINDNIETHFHPIIDSVKIYSVILGTFFRYMLASLSSFLVDYGIFCGLIYALSRTDIAKTPSVWIATAVARVCSSLFNYTVNKKVVFKSRRGAITLLMYYALCVVQMAASAWLVSLIGMTGFPVQIAKIIVDSILFLISFRVQKTLIF